MAPEDAAKAQEEKKRAAQLDKMLQNDQQQQMNICKLLLLGAGESGKSTLFKQLITIYGRGYSEEERKSYTNIILQNTISFMKILVQQSEILSKEFADCKMNATSASLKPRIEELKDAEDLTTGARQLTDEISKAIATLWSDPGIKATFTHRAKFQMPDSAPYFFDRVAILARADYVPDQQDILRVRARTTGIVENQFDIGGNRFKMFDVGGQRNERKKWIHCFEAVTAVLFVVAASEYDQVLFEDDQTNRMVEALNLFEEMCNSRYFRDTAMILFLNKKDLFAEKIHSSPLSDHFPEYAGSEDPQEGMMFLQSLFEKRNHTGKDIYCHYTCATDVNNVHTVFNDVKDIIVRRSLAEAGLTGY